MQDYNILSRAKLYVIRHCSWSVIGRMRETWMLCGHRGLGRWKMLHNSILYRVSQKNRSLVVKGS